AREHLLAVGGDAVIAAPPLPGLLHPASLDEAALLEAIEQRIQRSDVEGEHPAGPRVDQLAQVVAVPRLMFDEREDEQFGAPFLHFPLYHAAPRMAVPHICIATVGRSILARHSLRGALRCVDRMSWRPAWPPCWPARHPHRKPRRRCGSRPAASPPSKCTSTPDPSVTSGTR